MVIIGIDPHKATHTAVAVDDREDEIASFRTTPGLARVLRKAFALVEESAA